MTTPAVGPIVALSYASAIDDPARFRSSKQTGAHFGLTPRKYQSGETDRPRQKSARSAMLRCARRSIRLPTSCSTKPVKGCAALKSWAMRIARRASVRKAKVALARKLAVIMHRMLADAKPLIQLCRYQRAAVAA